MRPTRGGRGQGPCSQPGPADTALARAADTHRPRRACDQPGVLAASFSVAEEVLEPAPHGSTRRSGFTRPATSSNSAELLQGSELHGSPDTCK